MAFRDLNDVDFGDVVSLRLPATPACASLGIAGQMSLVLVLPHAAHLLSDTWQRTHQIAHTDAGLIAWEPSRFRAAVEPGGPVKITTMDFTQSRQVRPAVWRRNPQRVVSRHEFTWSLHSDAAGLWLLREHDGRLHVTPHGPGQGDDAALWASMDDIERGHAY